VQGGVAFDQLYLSNRTFSCLKACHDILRANDEGLFERNWSMAAAKMGPLAHGDISICGGLVINVALANGDRETFFDCPDRLGGDRDGWASV
jgi:hypothetical protein